ncbi:MAG TPA: MBL fold metallo-hydrolase [Tepidisphaeraceae bacterium]|nr:MBL fold metallo-hydrolase [Tepidisphaeraceae bacterium]
MCLQMCILASGSAGNCAVLRAAAGQALLLDAGIGPRTTARRLCGTGVSLGDIRAICLSHLDHDHFCPTWLRTIHQQGIRVFCHENHDPQLRARLAALQSPPIPLQTYNGQPFEPIPGVVFHALPLAHDETGSNGFLIEGAGGRIGYASDLGHVPQALLERFCDLDVLAIESNYDPQMQLNSSRPWMLKQRIMGGRGHLSNQQAFEAVRAILDRCQRHARPLPRHIVLLHRSRQCNCPEVLRALFEQDQRIAPRLTLAEQFVRTDWLSVRPDRRPLAGGQLSLPSQT